MAFAPSKRRRLLTTEPAKVSLNAMLDIMTIILLFLLKTYSVSGGLTKPAIENLPESTIDAEPRKSLSVILTRDGLFEDTQDENGAVDFSNVEIIVEPLELASGDNVALPGLEKYLKERRDLEIALGKEVPSRELTIQAADNVPYEWILKLINSASKQEYDVFEFLVMKESAGGKG